MIRNYGDYLVRRWAELGMPAKIAALPANEPAQQPTQVGWLIQVVGELRHTTMHEGRLHPDVGLLFKNGGNFYDAGNGLTIANDIVCVFDTDDQGLILSDNFAIVDGIVAVNAPAAHPGWQVQGMAAGADIARYRVPPVPAGATPAEPGTGDGTLPGDTGGDPLPAAVPELVAIAGILIDMRTAQEADLAVQRQILAELQGIRQTISDAGDTLGKLLASGALGGVLGGLGGLFGRQSAAAPPAWANVRTDGLPSYTRGTSPALLRTLPVDFDRHKHWRDTVDAPATTGVGDGDAKDQEDAEAKNRRTNNR